MDTAQPLQTNTPAQPASQQNSNQIVDKLKAKVAGAQLPADVHEKIQDELMRIELVFKTKDFNPEIDRQINYINFVLRNNKI